MGQVKQVTHPPPHLLPFSGHIWVGDFDLVRVWALVVPTLGTPCFSIDLGTHNAGAMTTCTKKKTKALCTSVDVTSVLCTI